MTLSFPLRRSLGAPTAPATRRRNATGSISSVTANASGWREAEWRARPPGASSCLGGLPASGRQVRAGPVVRKPCRGAHRPLPLAGVMGEDPPGALDRALQRCGS